MEFFLPSLLILLVAAIVVFTFLPRLAPMILLLLSAGLLTFGVYHHYKLFKNEYRESTWQDNLKYYGPAGIIVVMIIMLIIFILSFFKGGAVPIPEMPEMPVAMNVMDAATAVTNTVANTMNSVANSVANTVTNTMNNITNTVTGAQPNNGSKRRNNIPRSFFEEI